MSNSQNFKSPEAEAKYFSAYDDVLKLWPVPYESINIDTSFGSTHVLVSGHKDDPPIIFLHAFSASATEWYKNVSDISKEYSIYAVEIPGDLNKSVLTKSFSNRSGCVSWLSEVMNELNIDKAVFVGHSYGGWFTLNFSLLAPDRVSRAILLAPARTFGPTRNEFYIRALAMQLVPCRFFTESFLSWASAKGYKTDEEVINLFFEGMRAFNFAKNFVNIVQPTVFTDNELKNINVPVLLLMGEQENLQDPFKAVERARKLMKNIHAEIIPDAGHSLNREQSIKINQLILKFIKE